MSSNVSFLHVNIPTTVITHSGVFHADEIFAIAAIRMFFGNQINIVRTRDTIALKDGIANPKTVLVDVGGVYDPENGVFDHHHRDFNVVRPICGNKYSSFGLVWNFYLKPRFALTKVMQDVFDYVDHNLVRGIDYTDNGVNYVANRVKSVMRNLKQIVNDVNGDKCVGILQGNMEYLDMIELLNDAETKLLKGTHNSALSISEIIVSMRPTSQDDDSWDMSTAFAGALDLAEVTLSRMVRTATEIEENKDYLHGLCFDSLNSEVIVSKRYAHDWQKIVSLYDHPVYFVFPDVSGQWRCQAVPPKLDKTTLDTSFGQRKPLPESWAGLSTTDFQKETGIPDAVFCHSARFICGAVSKESTIALAYAALNYAE